MTKQQYIEYLVATPNYYTCTHLADHLEGEAPTSHDTISDYLRREKLTPRRLWEVVQPLLHDSTDSYLIADISLPMTVCRTSSIRSSIRKRSSWSISRTAGPNTSGEDGTFFPIDFRVYAPETDGKTKNKHFLEMLIRVKSDKCLTPLKPQSQHGSF